MEKIGKVCNIVEKCLALNPRARNNDWYLYTRVLEQLHKDPSKITVMDIANDTEDFPSFESVTRARRKFQEMGRFLPCTEVKDFRTQQEFEFYKEFA